MVDVTPGDSGANKGFWRFQLRDRYGRFVEMGGGVVIEVSLPGVRGTVRARGVFREMFDLENAKIEVLDSTEIPKGIYTVNRKFIEAINEKARLSKDYVKNQVAKARGEVPSSSLQTSISGSEALKIRLKSVARALKEEGRFPIPRQASNEEIASGKPTDISKGAKIDYRKVFDSEPGLQEKYKSFENMWEYVRKNSVAFDTQSPNELSEIPEAMKELNRAYAKHVLNLDPDGFITVYRNAVNGKDTEAESAVGYVSLDRQMAWDYNSGRENVGKNGRYEISVKPDEVFGMLGYSQVEDEYGLTIGRGVTSQEGRVRRVGDLESAVLPDWLEEWNKTFQRGRGQSPLRFFGLAGEYDLHKVDDFGKNLEEFLAKYNLQASDIAAMFNKLYGEGAYAEYKASGNAISFQLIRKMFMDLENGKIGLNLPYLEKFQELKPNSAYKGDQFDNIMKMLSVFQELTGQYFMTHKTREYEPA